MKRIVVFVLVLCMFFLTACEGGEVEPVKGTEIFFDTVVEIELFDGSRQLLDEAMQLCEDYQKLFDPDDPESDVYRLNNSGGEFVKVSEDTLAILEKSIYYSSLSGGAFDITSRPVSVLWSFTDNDGVIPSSNEIDRALQAVDYNNIKIEQDKVRLENSAQVDFGAVAKGYVADKLRQFLLDNDCKNAVLNIGGNVLFLGENKNREAFSAGIQEPFSKTGEICAYIGNIRDASVVTCGNYMRYFEKDGKIYHHIIDTVSGMPVENDLNSVTVICENSTDADCLSTVCFTLGSERGQKLIESLEAVEAVFVLKSGEVICTSGLRKTEGDIPKFVLKS